MCLSEGYQSHLSFTFVSDPGSVVETVKFCPHTLETFSVLKRRPKVRKERRSASKTIQEIRYIFGRIMEKEVEYKLCEQHLDVSDEAFQAVNL